MLFPSIVLDTKKEGKGIRSQLMHPYMGRRKSHGKMLCLFAPENQYCFIEKDGECTVLLNVIVSAKLSWAAALCNSCPSAGVTCCLLLSDLFGIACALHFH